MGSIVAALMMIVVGVIGWGARLEIKTNVQGAKHEDLKEFFEKLLTAKTDPINQRLDRIERSLNGGLHRD